MTARNKILTIMGIIILIGVTSMGFFVFPIGISTVSYTHLDVYKRQVLFQGSIGRADLTGGNFDELREHICSRLFVLPPRCV